MHLLLSAWRIILKARAPSQPVVEERSHGTTVWKGTSPLVDFHSYAMSAPRARAHQLQPAPQCVSFAVKQPLFCPVCNRNVERSEIVKGTSMKRISTCSSARRSWTDVSLLGESHGNFGMVKLDDMDPLYFDSLITLHQRSGREGLQLLMSAMQDSGLRRIAKLTMHQREHIVILRPGSKE